LDTSRFAKTFFTIHVLGREFKSSKIGVSIILIVGLTSRVGEITNVLRRKTLHHLSCMKPYGKTGYSQISTAAGFLPSKVDVPENR